MPEGIEELQISIKRAVEKYEPRLKKIKVTPLEVDKKDFKLVFILSAELAESGSVVRFQTTFTSIGKSSISPWKKVD